MHGHLADSDYFPFETGVSRSVALGRRGLLLLILDRCYARDIGSEAEWLWSVSDMQRND